MADQSPILRLGIVVDSLAQPRWVRRSLEKALASGVAKLELVVKVEPATGANSSLLYKLYNRFDRKLFKADATELVSIEDLLVSVKVSGDVTGAELDVIVNFSRAELNAKLAASAPHGVWFYSFGDAPGFKELSSEIPITYTSLRALKGNTESVVYESFTPTLSRFSVRLNNNTCYWKSAAFVARALGDLYARRELAKNTDGQPLSKSPGNVAMTQMLLKLSSRAAARVYEKRSSLQQWVLAYQIKDGEFQYLVPPLGRFWADPFPLKVDGKYYIFFEDYVNELGRAHIAVVEVDENGIVNGPKAVLKLECHLSYPFVFEWQGDYYMIPESGHRHAVELYRAISFPFEWRMEKTLLDIKRPLDTTVIEMDGTWWMFLNLEEEGVAVNWDELHLYYSDSLFGPWKPHARNPIVSDVRSARPAGKLFWSNDVLYRPGQDSSIHYGYATTINKITELSPVAYNETEVVKILPDWDDNIIGIHTLNFADDLTVIDCLTKRKRKGSARFRSPKRSLDLLTSANIQLGREARSGSISRVKT